MIRAKDLDGRAVIDLVTAEKIGYIDEIFIDPSGGRLAALKVSTGSSLLGGGRQTLVPSSAIESIGPEAVMVRPSGEGVPTDGPLDALPRLSHIVGRKVVSETGKLLGTIGDVLIEDADGRVFGYELKDASWSGGLGDLLNGGDDHQHDYVRGDAELRLSDELLVVPDSAVVRERVHADDTAPTSSASAIDRLSDRDPAVTRQTVDTTAPISPRREDDVRPRQSPPRPQSEDETYRRSPDTGTTRSLL